MIEVRRHGLHGTCLEEMPPFEDLPPQGQPGYHEERVPKDSQNPLINEYTLNHLRVPIIIQGIFLSYGVVETLWFLPVTDVVHLRAVLLWFPVARSQAPDEPS